MDWTENLEKKDLNFVKRFVLASGSLKQLAQEYDVSYPTVRLRLDRLIARIEAYEEAAKLDSFEQGIKVMTANGQISSDVAQELLSNYEKVKGIKS